MTKMEAIKAGFAEYSFGFCSAKFHADGPGGVEYMLEFEEDMTHYEATTYRWDSEAEQFAVIRHEERDEMSQLSALRYVLGFAADAASGELDSLEEVAGR